MFSNWPGLFCLLSVMAKTEEQKSPRKVGLDVGTPALQVHHRQSGGPDQVRALNTPRARLQNLPDLRH